MSGLFEVYEPEIPPSLVLAEFNEMQEQNVGQKLLYDFRSSDQTMSGSGFGTSIRFNCRSSSLAFSNRPSSALLGILRSVSAHGLAHPSRDR